MKNSFETNDRNRKREKKTNFSFLSQPYFGVKKEEGKTIF